MRETLVELAKRFISGTTHKGDTPVATDLNKARIQDVVATLSHVKLRQTVRVLRGLAMAAQVLGHKELAAELNEVLYKSTRQGNYPSPLHSKPEYDAVEACYEAMEAIEAEFGATSIKNMVALEDDPYFDNRISANFELRT